MLGKAGVKGVLVLVHEQQSLFTTNPPPPYSLRVLACLVSTPRGDPIFSFTSLAKFLVGLIDCICAHRDALKDACVLHRDISLFNLLLVAAMQSDLGVDFVDHVLHGSERARIREKIQKLSRRGLLGDWGYAIPVPNNSSPDSQPQAPSATAIPTGSNSSSDMQSQVPHHSTPVLHVMDQTKHSVVSPDNLLGTHDIVIPVADEDLPNDTSLAIDKSALQRTLQGTWAWMAAELALVGPGVLVPKPAKVLAQCFDPFFAVTQPSIYKTLAIQSDVGWTALMIPHISPYFQPLIALLEDIWRELILPIKLDGKKLQANWNFSHDNFIDAIVMMLSNLPESYWLAKAAKKGLTIVPQSMDTSSAASISSMSSPTWSLPTSVDVVTLSLVLSSGHLARLPLIHALGSSSRSSSKRRSEALDANSRSGKRRPQDGQFLTGTSTSRSGGFDVSSTASWAKVDIPRSASPQLEE
ncbi:hypothetical protein EV363DRAFT_1299830 [Boletus edulis]|nr:hypothetical protein EV363DRAFT_1299830 [Boletus edulis]